MLQSKKYRKILEAVDNNTNRINLLNAKNDTIEKCKDDLNVLHDKVVSLGSNFRLCVTRCEEADKKVEKIENCRNNVNVMQQYREKDDCCWCEVSRCGALYRSITGKAVLLTEVVGIENSNATGRKNTSIVAGR